MAHRGWMILVLGGAGLLGACAGGESGLSVNDIPASLRAPPNLLLTLQALGTGVQIYQCAMVAGDATRYAWTLKGPEATLYDKGGKKIGRHFAGPTWEGNDGSSVVGEVVSRADSPSGDSIPWLLLSAKSNSGRGLFASVKFIQRLHTVGGKAPTAECSGARSGAERREKYAADYFFYIATRT